MLSVPLSQHKSRDCDCDFLWAMTLGARILVWFPHFHGTLSQSRHRIPEGFRTIVSCQQALQSFSGAITISVALNVFVFATRCLHITTRRRSALFASRSERLLHSMATYFSPLVLTYHFVSVFGLNWPSGEMRLVPNRILV